MARILGHQMRTFALTMERRARVWIDSSEMPGVMSVDERRMLKYRDVYCRGNQKARRTAIAVELFIPVGGRFLYGMLGGKAFGSEASQSLIEIADMTSHGRVVVDSLAGSLDTVVPWVDAEYYDSILDGASAAVEGFEAFPDKFVFCSGRQGALGSTPILFRRLAHICVALLAAPDADIEKRLEERGGPVCLDRDLKPISGALRM